MIAKAESVGCHQTKGLIAVHALDLQTTVQMKVGAGTIARDWSAETPLTLAITVERVLALPSTVHF